ncbi:MAG: RidA family protein [Sphingobacteriaceae bacterium]|nr:RidA family protein [Cytophagaceae bacterium]
MARKNITTGTPWEGIVGYARAVRLGNVVEVSGTVASDEQGRVIGPGDATAQTRYILQKIEMALTEAGASLSDVVRTRIFVTDIRQWESIGRAHGEVFAAIRPATSMVEVRKLIGDEFLVEIEATALLTD